MYVLDTNTLIYFFKGTGSVAQRLLQTAPSEIALPAIVVYELETGILKSTQPERRSTQLTAIIEASQVLPFDRQCAGIAARLRTDLERLGTPIGPMDLLIAATALAHDGVLVTHNVREFGRVPDLRLTDWHG